MRRLGGERANDSMSRFSLSTKIWAVVLSVAMIAALSHFNAFAEFISAGAASQEGQYAKVSASLQNAAIQDSTTGACYNQASVNSLGYLPAAEGRVISFTVLPYEGYEVSLVMVNGDPLSAGADGQYRFTPGKESNLVVSCVPVAPAPEPVEEEPAQEQIAVEEAVSPEEAAVKAPAEQAAATQDAELQTSLDAQEAAAVKPAVVEELAEAVPAEEPEAFEAAGNVGGVNFLDLFVVGGIQVTVSAEPGVLPAGTRMVVTPAQLSGSLAAQLGEDFQVVDIAFFDAQDNEIEPNGLVNVTLSNVAVKGDQVSVFHITDSDVVEVVAEGLQNTGTVSFAASQFSRYAVSSDLVVVSESAFEEREEKPLEAEAFEDGLRVTKESDKKGTLVELGELVTYTITVTNTSTVPYKNVKVVDGTTHDRWSIALLEPGETKTFTSIHKVDGNDMLAGALVSTVVARADKVEDPENPKNFLVPQGSATAVDRLGDVKAGLFVSKVSDKQGQKVALGSTITYAIMVTNTGNVPCTNVVVEDGMCDFTEVVPELGVGATKKFTAQHKVTEDDIMKGFIVSTATARADAITDPKDSSLVQVPEGNDTTTDEAADLDATICVIKTSNVPAEAVVSEGDVVTYTISVQNIGNTAFENVAVNDELTGMYKVIPDLGVGAVKKYKTTHTVTAADIAAGHVLNEVVAQGASIQDPKNPGKMVTPEGSDVEDDPTAAPSVPSDDPQFVATPSLYIENVADKVSGVVAGDTVTYSVTVVNNGNVVLTDIVVTMPLTGSVWEIESLAPGEYRSFSASYVITEADMLNGMVANGITATSGNGYDVETRVIASTELTTVSRVVAGMGLVKWVSNEPANGEFYVPGEEVAFQTVVSNYGNVALNNVVLTDSLDGLGNKATLGILAPGETVTIDSLYGVTEEDAHAGVVKTSVTGEAACNVPGISTVSAASGEISVRAGVEEIPSMPTPLAQATPHGLDIPWVPLLAATTGAALLLLLLILLRRRRTEEKQ